MFLDLFLEFPILCAKIFREHSLGRRTLSLKYPRTWTKAASEEEIEFNHQQNFLHHARDRRNSEPKIIESGGSAPSGSSGAKIWPTWKTKKICLYGSRQLIPIHYLKGGYVLPGQVKVFFDFCFLSRKHVFGVSGLPWESSDRDLQCGSVYLTKS